MYYLAYFILFKMGFVFKFY